MSILISDAEESGTLGDAI